MRILWHSNAPWCGTGYGNQTALVLPRLAADGHVVACSANYGLQGGRTSWKGIRVYPLLRRPYGDDAFAYHSEDHEADWSICLYDVWAFSDSGFTSWAQQHNVAAWVPVDHRPVPPAVAGWFHKTGAVPIAMSKFGRDQLDRSGLTSLYAPHGVDTSVYAPADDVAEARDLYRIPQDAYVVLMNAANKGQQMRKGFAEAMLAFGQLARERSDALLFMHTCDGADRDPQSIDLPELAASCGIPEGQIQFIPQYAYLSGSLPDEALAKLYRAADVLLAPSKGEGFGIPVIEAQACGRPVIVSNFTAQPELVRDGWLVDGEPEWDPAQGSWFFRPYVESIFKALAEAYERGRGDSVRAVEGMRSEYDADLVHDLHWRPIMAELAERIPSREAVKV